MTPRKPHPRKPHPRKPSFPAALALVTLGGLGGLPACQGVNTTQREAPTARPDVVPDRRVELDGTLSRKAAVIEVRQGRTPGGLLRVEVDVQNLTRRQRRIDYRFEFTDSDGLAARGGTPGWLQERLQSGELLTLSATSPTPTADDFTLKLLEANTLLKPR